LNSLKVVRAELMPVHCVLHWVVIQQQLNISKKPTVTTKQQLNIYSSHNNYTRSTEQQPHIHNK